MIANLRAELEARLAAGAGTPDGRILEEPTTRDLDLDRPLALLGAGSVLAQPFVADAVTRLDVRALVDNGAAGRSRHGRIAVGNAGFRDLARAEPRLLAVMCCSGEDATRHFTALAESVGVPALTLPQALRRAGLPSWHQGFGNLAGIARLLAEGVLDQFADDLSRRTFLSLLLHRLSWSPRWLDPVRLPERDAYFLTDALAPGDDEILVDGGASIGDTIQSFSRRTGGRWRHIHAFEPDPARLPVLHAAVRGLPAVTVHAAGLWSQSAGAVACAAVSGHIAITGHDPIEGSGAMAAAALDDLDLGPVSLIKMDIEGAEARAIAGARRTIARHKPKLAICVYHLPRHIAEIPALIREIRPDYTLRLRHHGPSLFETVLYAV